MDLVEKYRPRRLKDLVGQSAAIAQIEGMLASERVHKCILISGATGHGKTSLARIIAYLINGVRYGDDLPDLVNESIGASRGIDNIREIVTAANYAPQHKYRVILLDEIHLLTTQAASALLGPIEDSPPRTVWILVSNEPEKLLPTIIRRSYHIALQIPTRQDIRNLLWRVCRKEHTRFPQHNRIIRRLTESSAGSPAIALQTLQAAMDYHSSNPDSTDSKALISAALNVLESRANDRIAAKLIIAIYLGKQIYALRAIQQIVEPITVVNAMLNFNLWLLNQHSGHRGFWHPLTKQIARYIKKPNLGNVLWVHGQLVNLRLEMQRFAINETHLLTARIGNITQHKF